ncbi:glycosyltransferase family 4 protein [Sphingomonas sp. Mn802worker]|uniref:glycosyltransferase family 4 protein n=1 Tax=Sphingomonas sp. Mn802worker TaxID=629773 RepID=UPI000375CDA5|nr:glycosyltransferase family 4 protein [Sphingomonas sp. Mn802worker]
MQQSIVLSINTAWNFVNFRAGLIRRLIEEGFDVVALAPADAHVDRLCDMGVRFVAIEIDRKGLSPSRDLQLLRRYRQVLREMAPAAYLGWTIKPNIWGSIAAAWLRIPTINNISGLGTAFMKPGPLQWIVRRLYRLALRPSATVFFQNAVDRQLFVDMKIVRLAQTALLPGSGIDLNAFAPAQPAPRVAAAPVTFLMIARLLGDKGVREFVEAARQLRAENLHARFVILGALDHNNRSGVAASELADWLAEGVIEHLPHQDDVRPAIVEADCVVLPSYREGMPRSLLEGAAMAKPLIASDVPGCALIAREGENGLLCRVKDAGSLADAMRRMGTLAPEQRAEMGAAGRRIAEREFDERIVVDLYVEAVRRAIRQ